MIKRQMAALLVCTAVFTVMLAAQGREESSTRTVRGVVTDQANSPAPKAVVQLKDTKTLQVRSFITQQDGAYPEERLCRHPAATERECLSGRSPSRADYFQESPR